MLKQRIQQFKNLEPENKIIILWFCYATLQLMTSLILGVLNAFWLKNEHVKQTYTILNLIFNVMCAGFTVFLYFKVYKKSLRIAIAHQAHIKKMYEKILAIYPEANIDPPKDDVRSMKQRAFIYPLGVAVNIWLAIINWMIV